MKKALLLTVIVTLAAFRASATQTPVISVLSTSSSILYLKFDKSIYGAQIEVKNEKGEVIISETVNSKKLIIDFYDHEVGTYKVSINKGDVSETITYTTIEPSTAAVK